MPRATNSVASRTRRKKILKMAKGYYGARKNVWTVAKNAVEKGLLYAAWNVVQRVHGKVHQERNRIKQKGLSRFGYESPRGF